MDNLDDGISTGSAIGCRESRYLTQSLWQHDGYAPALRLARLLLLRLLQLFRTPFQVEGSSQYINEGFCLAMREVQDLCSLCHFL